MAFMDENFLLDTESARRLYFDYAAKMPVYDYHCHLDVKEIAADRRFDNITCATLGGDHYKWRAMRANGVDERYCTGDAPDYDKFLAWARTLPMAIGNPLYHWAHLELQRYFGIDTPLNEQTAPQIWQQANEQLAKDEFSARGFIQKSNVKVICTTDDPLDSLEHHRALKGTMECRVLPAFRPDKALNINADGFKEYIQMLGAKNFGEVVDALLERMNHFHSNGCRLSDCSLTTVPYNPVSKQEADKILKKALGGEKVEPSEEEGYRTVLLGELFKGYARLGWTMQLHIGAQRNNNSRMFNAIGVDTGYDSIADGEMAQKLAQLMDSADAEGLLPKTILYSLNPKDNYVLGAMAGNFQDGKTPGKIQLGAAWWFNDSKDGMVKQMTDLANLGLLGRFVGMLTDSRSFLSYVRHEYFRRILCGLLGKWVANGEYPEDYDTLGEIVKGICYENAERYFNM